MPQVSADQIFQQDPEWMKENYPQIYSQYVEKVGQPGAGLQQTQTSTQATQAQIPGIQAQSTKEGIQAQQAGSPLALKSDLTKGMTLRSAISKYTALGMNADDVFKNYIAQSPYGLPNESVNELQTLGVSPAALGDVKTPGSFMDRQNTKNVINELRGLKDTWNQTGALAHLPFLGDHVASGRIYNAQKQIVGEHLSSVIPGASNSQGSNEANVGALPSVGDPWEPAAAQGQFNKVEQTIMQQKGFDYKSLGLKPPPPTKASAGGDVLNGIINMVLPTGGAIAGGAVGGLLGAAIPGADLTGVPEVAGAISGSGAGGAGGQALADLLTGKKPGSDVAVTGALSAGGEGVGAALGGILGKAGGSLAEKIPGNVFDKVVTASPNFSTDVTQLKGTAAKYGLLNGTSRDALTKMPQVMSDIGSQIQNGLSQVKTPVKVADVTKSILNDFSNKTNVFENTEDFNNARKYIQDRITTATGGKTTSYSDLYNLKSEVANDLKPVFKAQSNPNLSTNFTPKQEANLALWDGLKSEIDKADPNIRVLNNDQHNMFDVAKGLVKDATGRKGGGVVSDIFDTLAGNMLGGPIGGLSTYLGGRALRSEGGRAAISKVLQSGALKQGARAVSSGLGALLGVGASQ